MFHTHKDYFGLALVLQIYIYIYWTRSIYFKCIEVNKIVIPAWSYNTSVTMLEVNTRDDETSVISLKITLVWDQSGQMGQKNISVNDR